MEGSYHIPTALTALSGVFLALGALSPLLVIFDIIYRRGWRSMMGVMIPVYPINAAYMGPLTLYLYFRYGRPTKPVLKASTANGEGQGSAMKACHAHQSREQAETQEKNKDLDLDTDVESGTEKPDHTCHHKANSDEQREADRGHNHEASDEHSHHVEQVHTGNLISTTTSDAPHCSHHAASHSSSSPRPTIITVLIGVSHCGAGCVLGDLVGEWLVYGTNATLAGHSIWACLLIDYAFALLFGIGFQYFSIAPMSGDYSLKTVWRAAKADILSLTSFEIGAFGWMIIYQVGIWNYELGMDTWLYWWMMQVGMVMGFATAVPVNYFLLKWGIKEPCC